MTTLKIDQIVADPNQPRKYFDAERLAALAQSIKRYGIKEPLKVEKKGDKYLLIDGERRYRAAKDLKLKEVPVIIEKPLGDMDRLIEQFHIQELHEGWTPTEKAGVIHKLATDMRMGILEACKALGIPETTARKYVAFANLSEKKKFEEMNISLDYALPLQSLKNATAVAFNKSDNEDLVFNHDTQRKLEASIIERIADGNIKSPRDIVKIKDSITKQPEIVKTLIKNLDLTPDEIYKKTKAKGAHHLRNISFNSRYLWNNIEQFMKNDDVEVDPDTLKTVRKVIIVAQNFVKKYDRD